MDHRHPAQHPVGIRPGVWLFAAACLVAALGVAAGLTLRGAQEPAAAVAGSLDPTGAAEAAPSAREVATIPPPDAASSPPEGLPAPAPFSPHATLPEPGAGAPGAIAMERADAPADSRIAAEIRVLESEAARVAESLGLLPDEPRGASLDRAAEDARVQRLADALLIEHFVQDAYRGTEFPIDYPAEERTRAAAESQVRGLPSEMRRDLLDVVLQSDELQERIAPQFAPPESGFVWQSASR